MNISGFSALPTTLPRICRKVPLERMMTIETRSSGIPYVLQIKRNPQYIERLPRNRKYTKEFLLEVVRHVGGWKKLGVTPKQCARKDDLLAFLRTSGDLEEYVAMRLKNPVSENVICKPPADYTFVIATPETLQKAPRWFLEQIGMLIVDEVHSFYTKIRVELLLSITPEYFLACSATPYKSKKGYSGVILDIVGKECVVYRTTDDPYLVVKYNTGLRLLPGIDSKEDGYWNNLLQTQADHEERNRIAIEIIKAYPKRNAIIFTWRNDSHTPKVSKLLDEAGIDNSLYVGSQAEYDHARVMVTTISKSGEGFDQEAVCKGYDPEDPSSRISLMISTVTMRSKGTFRQIRGRVVGRAENPLIFMLSDINKVSESHCKQMLSSCSSDPKCTAIEMSHGGSFPESW